MTTKKLNCPECGKKFEFAKGMASHRLKMHGVAGSSKNTLILRAKNLQKLPPAVPLVAANEIKCPDCGEVFENTKRLGLHRRLRHKVKGTAHSSLSMQKHREAYLANYKRDKDGLCLCPECGLGFKAAGITNHRNQAHHISSETQAQMFENNKMVAKIEMVAEDHSYKCSQCDFVAKNEHGLRSHTGHRHGYSTKPEAIKKRERYHNIVSPTKAIVIAESNGHVQASAEEVHPVAGGYTIPEQTLALALGRFQGFCQSFAAEFDLPPRNFATRLAELIYHAQIR